MTTIRSGLLSWGLLVAIAGAATIYSVTIQPLTPLQVVVVGLAGIGLVLAVAALIPRTDSAVDTHADTAASEPSELLDARIGEQETLDAGGTEIDLGDR